MALVLLSGIVGAAIFGAAGWLGGMLADTWYRAVRSEADGPRPVVVPGWAFIAVPASIGAIVGTRGVGPLQGALLLTAVFALTVCASTDLRAGMLPDLFTLGPLAGVLALSAARRDWMPLLGAAFAFVPFAATAAVSRGRGMGWGDVKLAALGGALIGMGGITLAVALAAAAAFIVGAVQGRAREPIAFGPYLAVSIGAGLALGNAV